MVPAYTYFIFSECKTISTGDIKFVAKCIQPKQLKLYLKSFNMRQDFAWERLDCEIHF